VRKKKRRRREQRRGGRSEEREEEEEEEEDGPADWEQPNRAAQTPPSSAVKAGPDKATRCP
jgi:hypothetical protein